MKTTGLLNSFLLIAVREMVQDFLAFFRFTEADACVLLSAHGFYAVEVDRLQNSPNEQKETGGSLGKANHRQRISELPVPIPIGVHPNFTPANWLTASRDQVPGRCRVANHFKLRMETSRFSYSRPLLRVSNGKGRSHRHKRSMCPIPLAKASVASGIFVRFPYVHRPGQKICFDIATFAMVLILAASVLASALIILSGSIV
jgi:hypothetical protein